MFCFGFFCGHACTLLHFHSLLGGPSALCSIVVSIWLALMHCKECSWVDSLTIKGWCYKKTCIAATPHGTHHALSLRHRTIICMHKSFMCCSETDLFRNNKAQWRNIVTMSDLTLYSAAVRFPGCVTARNLLAAHVEVQRNRLAKSVTGIRDGALTPFFTVVHKRWF